MDIEGCHLSIGNQSSGRCRRLFPSPFDGSCGGSSLGDAAMEYEGADGRLHLQTRYDKFRSELRSFSVTRYSPPPGDGAIEAALKVVRSEREKEDREEMSGARNIAESFSRDQHFNNLSHHIVSVCPRQVTVNYHDVNRIRSRKRWQSADDRCFRQMYHLLHKFRGLYYGAMDLRGEGPLDVVWCLAVGAACTAAHLDGYHLACPSHLFHAFLVPTFVLFHPCHLTAVS